ncbi:hypothetical protein Taro_014828, partial [Colocasia esculenta]|nr:hypothetical protein [Colocasia esculenta]
LLSVCVSVEKGFLALGIGNMVELIVVLDVTGICSSSFGFPAFEWFFYESWRNMAVHGCVSKNLCDNGDDDDRPIVFKRTSAASKQSQLNSALKKSSSSSSQRNDKPLGKPASDQSAPSGGSLNLRKVEASASNAGAGRARAPISSNRAASSVQLKSSSSNGASNLNGKTPDSDDSEDDKPLSVRISVASPVSQKNSSLTRSQNRAEDSDDSDDDKPLSFRVSAGPVGGQRSNVLNAKKNSSVVSPTASQRSNPDIKRYSDDSEDEKPLSARMQTKPIAGKSARKADDSDDEKPLATRLQQNGSNKRPLTSVNKSGEPSNKKTKILDFTAVKIKREAVVKEEVKDDDDDHIPIAQRTKKLVFIKKQPSKKMVIKQVNAKPFKKGNMVKKTMKDNKYSKSFKVPPGSGEGQKWTTLEHNGVIFPPPYKSHGVKMLYNGKPVNLTPEQEEVATMFAVMKDTEYATKKTFIDNFMKDWRAILGSNHIIKQFELCDFTPIYEWHLREKEKKKQMSSGEKKAAKEEKLKQEEKYMWAVVDGVKEKVHSLIQQNEMKGETVGSRVVRAGVLHLAPLPRQTNLAAGLALPRWRPETVGSRLLRRVEHLEPPDSPPLRSSIAPDFRGCDATEDVVRGFVPSSISYCVFAKNRPVGSPSTAVVDFEFTLEDFDVVWLAISELNHLDYSVAVGSIPRSTLSNPILMGKLKKRIRPSDITINIGKDAPIPECPIPGERWKEIRHDNTVTWLAFWNDPINQREFKYVFLAASSTLKGQSDKEKYEKARKLKDYIQNIRSKYTKNFTSKDDATRQIAVATYLIDKLALRAGNEKEEGEEADTVGCCTLKVENVALVPPNKLQFDFLGKDSIRYFNTVEVEPAVYKAIGDFRTKNLNGKKKHDTDPLFHMLDTNKLNAHLKELMPGLTAKVFRTYNASITLDEMFSALGSQYTSCLLINITVLQLNKETKGGTVQEKLAIYQQANKEVAIICNHQRSVSKSHDAQMTRLTDKLAELKAQHEELKVDLSRARKGKPPLKDAEGKTKRNLSSEALEKKLTQLDAKIEKIELDIKLKDDLKTVALGTSKINYLDPRISVAWCKRHEVPIEKIFNKSLLAKFAWAMDADPSFRF